MWSFPKHFKIGKLLPIGFISYVRIPTGVLLNVLLNVPTPPQIEYPWSRPLIDTTITHEYVFFFFVFTLFAYFQWPFKNSQNDNKQIYWNLKRTTSVGSNIFDSFNVFKKYLVWNYTSGTDLVVLNFKSTIFSITYSINCMTFINPITFYMQTYKR